MKNKPEYMMIYRCAECGLDSGYAEDDKPVCHYCDHKTEMQLISKQKITAELLEQRLKDMSDRMMCNIQEAFKSMTEEDKGAFKEGTDPEMEMLLLLDKIQKFKESIQNLELKEPGDKEETEEKENKVKE